MAPAARPHHFLALLTVFGLGPSVCVAQFGGGGYDPPAPVCKKFKCPQSQKPAGNPKHKLWSYGCKDSGINMFNMASFDASDPMGGLNKNQGKNVDKCCVERDICKQTCGTTAKQCHDDFQTCQKKICKGDSSCSLSAMMSDMKTDPLSEDDLAQEDKLRKEMEGRGEKWDYEAENKKKQCRSYDKHQASACQCVPEDEWQSVTDSNLKSFYKKHNPEKLDANGEIKDIDEVWKKWKGKEPSMFIALATKYKKKAVMIKTAPSPPPYKPPPPPSPEEKKRRAEEDARWAEEDAKRAEEREENDAKRAKEAIEAEEGEEVEL